MKLSNENKIYKEWEDLFVDTVSKERVCTVMEYEIRTNPNKKPPNRTYLIPYHWKMEVEKEIKRMLDAGIRKHSNSNWCSGLVPIKTPDGSIRFCVDYRELNSMTVKDKYPLPNIEEIIDNLSGSVIYSCLDATAGYH